VVAPPATTWDGLVNEINALRSDAAKSEWLKRRLPGALNEIKRLLSDANVVLYGTAFLQKPTTPGYAMQVAHEDLNGFMSVIHGMDWSKPLVLVLHTPGGSTNAAESIVAYLRSKFPSLIVAVPAFAMSAGTMISLGADRIIMGRQSQLGPIDPQMPFGTRYVSARAIVEQFERAKEEVKADVSTAHVWAPVVQSLGPSLLLEAQNALAYSEEMVAGWLERWMFSGRSDSAAAAKATAKHFNDASKHKSHGRRIDRDEAREQHVVIDDLEDDQVLQEAVLTAYHVMSIVFDQGQFAKIIWGHNNQAFLKPVPADPNTKA
jgi:ClpP class serine protease